MQKNPNQLRIPKSIQLLVSVQAKSKTCSRLSTAGSVIDSLNNCFQGLTVSQLYLGLIFSCLKYVQFWEVRRCNASCMIWLMQLVRWSNAWKTH